MKSLKSTGKRALSLLLTFVFILSLPLYINAATVGITKTGEIITGNCGADGDNITYSLDIDSGVLTITGNGAMADYTSASDRWGGWSCTVPWFSKNTLIKSVVMSGNIANIANSAFLKCTNLTDIEIPETVTSIGERAFYDCKTLSNVNIPNVTIIGKEAFYNCGAFTSFIIPSGVTVIPEFAFWGCYELTEVKIPYGVTTIGNAAFGSCGRLSAIELPSSLKTIGNNVFTSCQALTSIYIPDSVTNMGENIFFNCQYLKKVKLPSGIKAIPQYCFLACNSLTDVEIPDGVTNIGYQAFAACKALSDIKIPSSVTTIGEYAFSYCSLNSVDIPESVTKIMSQAFADNTNLESVFIYGTNTSMGTDAFKNTSTNFTIYGYLGSTAQTYANSQRHNFNCLDYVLKVESKNGLFVPNRTFAYDTATTVNTGDIVIPPTNENVFLGLFSDSLLTTTVSETIDVNMGTTIYSGWENVGTLKAEAEDKTGSTATTSGFDLFGAQFREKTESRTSGLRFCTRVSKDLVSKIESKTGNSVECGYVLCKKDSVPENAELKVGMTTTGGSTIKENSAPIRYYDGNGYFVYTAVIVNIPDEMQGADIVARPYIKYTDVNGIQRYYYFTESGASNCGGGYYTSYTAVQNAHNSAQQ